MTDDQVISASLVVKNANHEVKKVTTPIALEPHVEEDEIENWIEENAKPIGSSDKGWDVLRVDGYTTVID